MDAPHVGEIRMFAGNFAPVDWMFCEGQLLPISEYETLFNVIGTTYGGDGQGKFALPDLRGRIPIHQGTLQWQNISYTLAEAGGVEEVTLTGGQIPTHSHPLLASTTNGTSPNPQGNVLAQTPPGIMPYIQDTPKTNMARYAIGDEGGGKPHTNFQPYLCINFIISLFGILP